MWQRIVRLKPTSVTTLDEDPDVTIDSRGRDIVASWPAPEEFVDLGLHVVKKDDLARTGIEAHHAYFWPHIEVVLASGRTIEHDFKIVGVLY